MKIQKIQLRCSCLGDACRPWCCDTGSKQAVALLQTIYTWYFQSMPNFAREFPQTICSLQNHSRFPHELKYFPWLPNKGGVYFIHVHTCMQYTCNTRTLDRGALQSQPNVLWYTLPYPVFPHYIPLHPSKKCQCYMNYILSCVRIILYAHTMSSISLL